MILPDIDSLKCFVAAAAHKNFRRAASEVALSPAAFSDRIGKLEDLLRVRLFARTTRTVHLTPEGEKVLVYAKAVISHARACLEAATAEPLPFDLVVGTRFELGLSWLVPAIDPLQKLQPERNLHLYFGDTDALIRALEHGTVDAVVTSARLGQVVLESVTLHEETYAFVGSPKLFKRVPLASHQDAAKHTIIDVHFDLSLFRYFLDGRPAKETWRFERMERMGTIGAIAERVRDGAGVAVLPRYFIKQDLAQKTLIEPFPKAKIQHDYFRLVWRRNHPRDTDLAKLADELKAIPLR